MFPDSEISKKYSCARTKTSAIVKEMCISSKLSVAELIKAAPFSISTDGSNNSGSKLYSIIVSCFNPVSSEVECNLLSVSNLEGDSTGINIAQLIINNLKDNSIPFHNCLALGADNANLMVGSKDGVAGNLKKTNPNLHVAGCICHLIDLAAEKGAACLPINIDEKIIDIFYYLEKSSKRKEKLKLFQQLHNTEVKKILKHVCTRWLSLGVCLSRLLDQWSPLLSFFKEEIKAAQKKKLTPSIKSCKIPKVVTANHKEKKSYVTSTLVNCKEEIRAVQKKMTPSIESFRIPKIVTASNQEKKPLVKSTPASSVFSEKKKREKLRRPIIRILKKRRKEIFEGREERIFMFLSSDINKAYCCFVRAMLPLFEKFNAMLQCRAPKIHVLHTIIKHLYKAILSKFVNPVSIKEIDCVFKVKYNMVENQKKDEDLVIGAATRRIIEELSNEEKKEFHSYVKDYFCRVCDYILNKFPIKDAVVLHAKVADVSLLSDTSFSDVNFF